MARDSQAPPLRKKVIQLVVATTSLAILVLCAANYLSLRKDLRDLVLRKLDGVVHVQGAQLGDGFRGLARDAEQLARDPATGEAIGVLAPLRDPAQTGTSIRTARRSISKVFAAFLMQRPWMTEIRLISAAPRARELVRVHVSGGRPVSVPPDGLRTVGDRPYVRAAAGLKPGKWHLSDILVTDRKSGAAVPVMTLVHAVAGTDGRPGALLAVTVDYRAFVQRIVASVPRGVEVFAAAASGDWMVFSARDLHPPLIRAGQDGTPVPDWARTATQTGSTVIDNDVALRTFSVELGGGQNMSITMRMQITDLIDDVNERLMSLFLLSLILLTVTAAVGTILSRRLAAPLSDLADGVAQPRQEFQPISLPIRGYREVEVLAGAFERLVNTLVQEGQEADAIFSAAADGILMTDLAGTILRVNDAAGRMFGSPPDVLVGRDVQTLMPPGERAAQVARLRAFNSRRDGAGSSIGIEVVGLRADGRTFQLEATINRLTINTRETLIAVMRDVSDRQARDRKLAMQAEELAWRATHDQLSGLLNRRGIEEAMQSLAARGSAVTVIQIDLDRFKLVNDTLGHEAGDTVIRSIAERLREIARPQDFLGRMGGDEFVVLRDDNDPEATEAFSARAMAHLSRPVRYRDRICRFGVSIGAASGSAALLASGELIKRADHALYRAKNEGRGQHRFFTPEMERRMADRASLAADLEVAIEGDQLLVEYMPKAASDTGRMIGLEALVRWHHPDRGILRPADFLPLAEDLKLTETIDHKVLLRVLQDREIWAADGLDVPAISVNVSARRLRDPELVGTVRDLDIPRGAISFELLESIFLDEASDAVMWSVDALREMGIGIEIDDFGSGHASILGITQIQPDWIKIDKALIRHIEDSYSNRTLVRAITEMAAPFGISTLAEGVETASQAEILREIGCAALQGFYFGRPQNAQDIRQRLHPVRSVSA